MPRNYPRRAVAPPLLALAIASAQLIGCDADELGVDDEGPVEPRDGTGSGGPRFNTNVLIGTDVAAIDTYGVTLDGVRLTQLRILRQGGYTTMDPRRLTVDHGTLRGYLGSGPFYIFVSGVDFIGSQWTFDVNGLSVMATLTHVETSNTVGLYNPTSTTQLLKLDPQRLVYTFHYTWGTETPVATCANDPDGGSRMVIYGDLIVDEDTGVVSSRAHTVYFGCLSGAVGKSALWGYAPDSPSLPSLSLAGFETGIRTVRADYCGDGDSYTMPGNALTLRDHWGINTPPALPYTTEAVWEEGTGAVCLSRIRESGATLATPHVCPDGSIIPLCASPFLLGIQWNQGYGDIWTKIP